MIKLTNSLWIGDATDEHFADLATPGIEFILNVAHDLVPTRGWDHGVEYAHVGIVDGPGNPKSTYYAAVLALASMLERGSVLVCCHSAGRSMAVCLMLMNVSARRKWDELVELLVERLDRELPDSNEAHKAAYDEMDWDLLAKIIGT